MTASTERRALYQRRERAVLASLAVLGLIALTIFGLVKTFGLGPEERGLVGPIAIVAAATGFVALFSWARSHRENYGLEPAVDGGQTPRWYLRIALLSALLVVFFATVYSPNWFGLAMTVALVIPVMAIYRSRRMRAVRRWLWVRADEEPAPPEDEQR